MLYYSISFHNFDTYNCQPREDVYLPDILNNLPSDYWLLCVDDLPNEIEDIRGKIQNEPESIYAYRDYNGCITYFGIDE